MTAERIIFAVVWLICVTALLLVPKDWRREAQAVFLFQQLVNWILGLVVVQMGWLTYPVRGLHKNMTSFTFEFLAYPTVAVYMNMLYPEQKRRVTRFLYITLFSLGITIVESLIEKYTKLIDYYAWKPIWTFLSVWATLYLSRVFYLWFFRPEHSPAKPAKVRQK